MKIFLLVVFLLFCVPIFAQELHVKVVNPAPFDRPTETIELQWSEVQKALNSPDLAFVHVFENEQQLLTQVIDVDGDGTPDILVFQSAFKQGEEKQFIVKKTNDTQESKPIAVAMFMVPREDVAWENDRIAYRIYGSALAGDVRSGVDVLTKRVRYPVLAGWYAGDTLKGKKRISYHVDHGEGADYFDVKKSLGGGGSALWEQGTMIESGLFTSNKIIASGPIRAMFQVKYERDTLNGKPFTEIKTYTLDAGENLNKIEVSYSGLEDQGAEKVALGLVKRANVTFASDEKQGWFSLWGLANEDSAKGYIGTGVVVAPSSYSETKDTLDHFLMIANTSADKKLTYYGGGGWSKSGDFASGEDWKKYLSNFSQRLLYPLKVTLGEN